MFYDSPRAISLSLGDGAYETIQLEQPFKYAGKAYSQLYVSVFNIVRTLCRYS